MAYQIHISDVKTFKTCRRRWDWSSPLRRNLERSVPYMPFFTGRAVHHCIEMYYRDGTPMMRSLEDFLNHERVLMGDLWPQEEENVQEQIDLLVGMLDHYMTWIVNPEDPTSRWNDDNLEFLALETAFEVPIRTPSGRASPKIRLGGRMDGVVRLKSDGTVWIWENKTARSIQELQRSLANDPQTGAYIYAAHELFDVKPRGVLYNILRKKLPTHAETVQGGLLTRRKNIDTTAQMYIKDIRENHPDWDSATIEQFYGDIIRHLLDEGNKFFARVGISRSPVEIANLSDHLYVVGLEMTDPKVPVYPNESWLSCNYCMFRSPCLTLNAGGDYEFLLANEYQRRIEALSWRELEDREQEVQ